MGFEFIVLGHTLDLQHSPGELNLAASAKTISVGLYASEYDHYCTLGDDKVIV